MSRYIDTEWLENNAKEYSLGYYEEDEWATPLNVLDSAPSIDIVRCRECKYASDDGTYGCMCEHFNDTSDAYHRMWSDDFCSRGERNRSEKPNNCEHITEDGVTCAKYPACDDCLDNPLNKVKGSERLVKGSEKPNNCETCKWWEGNTNFCYSKADSDDHACHYEPKDKWQEERSSE